MFYVGHTQSTLCPEAVFSDAFHARSFAKSLSENNFNLPVLVFTPTQVLNRYCNGAKVILVHPI